MIVDTNVLLRSLEGATSAQAKAVRNRVQDARESGERLTVLAATVLDAAYALASPGAGYGWDRADIARAIDAVLDEPAFAIEHTGALRSALSSYRARPIDLRDCLLSAAATEHATRVLSFDEDLRTLGNGEHP
ncbi:MAG: PIN domain-containing protein [Solirubrobacteraceae bacterium]